MPYIFDNLRSIEDALSRRPFGLITDVDGTISEIAPSPLEARVSSKCKRYLSMLVGRLELVAAISGRPAIQAQEMVGIEGMVYVGIHGLERRKSGATEYAGGAGEYVSKVRAAIEKLGSLTQIAGVSLEDKGIALAVHYRNCADKESALGAIRDGIATFNSASEFKVIEGKMVIELRPPVAADKGTAVRGLINEYRLNGGIYLGDDITDIDAFREMHPPHFLSVCVYGEETPEEVKKESGFTVNSVNDVAGFLEWLSQKS